MRKRFLSVLLALCMLLTLLPGTALAASLDETAGTLTMQYDDYYTASGTVELTEAGTDTAGGGAVLALDGKTLHAVGLGTAKVTIGGTAYAVTVTKAKVNIILVGGQSNATGETNGNYRYDYRVEFDTAPVECIKGTAYLWGRQDTSEPALLTGSDGRGWRSGLAKELYAETGVKTAIVYNNPLTARPGANITEWLDDDAANNPDVGVSAAMVTNCYNYFDASAYYDVASCGLYWLQGEANMNAKTSATEYYALFRQMYSSLKAKCPVSYCAFLRVRQTTQTGLDYTGPVVAQFQMANDYADMFMASTLTENWVADDYETPITVDTSEYLSFVEDSVTEAYYKLFGGYHYYQRGYNILGADAACNMTKSASDPANAIIMGDTTGRGSANTRFSLGEKLSFTKAETEEMTKDLMFYAAPGSQASTVSVAVTSDGTDVTSRVVAASGSSAYLVNMAALKQCKDPTVTAIMKDRNGTVLGTAQVSFTTGVTVNPEPGDETAAGVYYHWDLTDRDTYRAGLTADGSTDASAPMQIKTASDSQATGYLMYNGETNEALSYSETDGLVRDGAIRGDASTEYKNAFVIRNNQLMQGITATLTDGFLIEFTASTPNQYGIVLGNGSNFANSGHPLLYFNYNSMKMFSPDNWVFDAIDAQKGHDQLATYRFLHDGEKLHLTVTRASDGQKLYDSDVDMTKANGDWVINYLFPAFSTRPLPTEEKKIDKDYLFAGNLTDLKIATDAYKTLTIKDENAVENSFEVVGVENGARVPTFEGKPFLIRVADGSELVDVTVTNAELEFYPATQSYVLCNVTGDVTLNVQTQESRHSWVEVRRTEPTCTVPGTIYYECSDEGCDATKQESLPAAGHQWDNGTVVTAPSGIVDGVLRYTCKVCAETRDEAIPAGGNYYHWDFTDKKAYVSGLEEDGKTSKTEQVRIKSASDSPELYWSYCKENTSDPNKIYWVGNDTLAYSPDGISRKGNTKNGFHLVDKNGKATAIDMTSANGFKLEITMNMTAGNNYSFVLATRDGNNPPWLYRDSGNKLKLGNYENYIDFDVSKLAGKMVTYTYSYDGKNTYHIYAVQDDTVLYDKDVTMTGTPYENYLWKVLMPCWTDGTTAFQGTIQDLKIWTNTNYGVTVNAGHASTDLADDATIAADGTLTFTVTPDDGYHVTGVTASNGVVTKNDDGTYTLAYVTGNSEITVTTEAHDWKTWGNDADEHWQICAVCGDTSEKREHVWDSGTVTRKPTCTESGEKVYTCDTCGATRTETIQANGHTLTRTEAQAATCTAEGHNAYDTCSVCQKVFKADGSGTETTVAAETVAALGHKMVKTEAKAATYAEEGHNEYYTCSVCQKVFKDAAGTVETTVEAETLAKLVSDDSDASIYPVSVPGASNGSVSVTPKNASRGDTVTITVTPKSGYEIDSVTVKDNKGNTLKLTDKGNGVYTFTMPAGRVTVSAAFAALSAQSFRDVPAGSYYADAVKWAVENGITEGTGNAAFSPNAACTRAQIVTFLWRAAGCPAPKSTKSFADVPTGAYYANAVAWAVENGITEGTSATTFSPNAACTRAQCVAFLFRSAAANGMDAVTLQDLLSAYADADSVPGYAVPAMNWALYAGILQGDGTNLMPNAACTRAQIVTFLFRANGGK